MIYSYAITFAGVTLRIWLPSLAVALNSFDKAYDIATWTAWVANLIVAYFINEGWRLPAMFKAKTKQTELVRK